MKIKSHKLVDDKGAALPFMATPNMDGLMQPEYLVLHYTAASNVSGVVDWFRRADSKVSAHLVIGRDGSLTQMVPFNRIAWHAGKSQWDGRSGLNKFSIGIEMDNAGRMERVGNRWQAVATKRVYPDDEVLIANHKHDHAGAPPCGWHAYTEAQIDATLNVCMLLMRHYGLKDVLGHEDIAPGRKSDPGPAFPMASVRSRLLGREDDAELIYFTTASLNVRSGPGVQHPILPGSPLPLHTHVAVQEQQEAWWRITLPDAKDDTLTEGWVNSRFLKS